MNNFRTVWLTPAAALAAATAVLAIRPTTLLLSSVQHDRPQQAISRESPAAPLQVMQSSPGRGWARATVTLLAGLTWPWSKYLFSCSFRNVGTMRHSDPMSDSPALSIVSDVPGSPTPSIAPAGANLTQENRIKSLPPGAESLLCPTCRGVIVGVEAGAFTVLRGQLIVSHGYCQGTGCNSRTPSTVSTASGSSTDFGEPG
ncbi:hypothetical protein [Nonomuraea thailandensis]|uniref:hypothetical protein n=1 Tax=Nonomuraea thailandensis TaxID=1188745 RepID=UPI003378871D